jgi:NADH:ubiquinone oxidoreductase subunit H
MVYEVPMVIALLVPVLLARSMGLRTIVGWNHGISLVTPLAAIIFDPSCELGQAPFGINGWSEIVADFM